MHSSPTIQKLKNLVTIVAMKSILYRLMGLLLLVLASLESNASHIYGAELTYTCVNSCTTRVHLALLRDCTGTMILGTGNITWTGAPGCVPPPPLGPYSPRIVQEVSPLCPGSATLCNSPSAIIGGVELIHFYRDYNTCGGSPCVYGLYWGDCCRAPSITALQNAGAQGIWIDNTRINTALPDCNNSPQFLNTPRSYIYAGQDVDISMGAWDPDGDSLTFELGPCFHSPGVPVTYNSGYSGAQPFGQTWNMSLDHGTGLLHLEANPGNITVGVVCVYVTEYRNGVEIGRVMRDMQLVCLPIPSQNQPPIVNHVTNLSPNATLAGDHIYMCSAGPVCFDVTTQDSPVLGQTHSLTWSKNLSGATFTEIGNPLVQDSIVGSPTALPQGRFCWTPPGNGHYYVRFRSTDSECPMPGMGERNIAIHVGMGPADASVTVGTCPQVSFTANGCGTGPFTYTWSGDGGFSSTQQHPSFDFPGPGTYNWSVVVSNGWFIDTVQGTVTVPNTPQHLNLFNGVYYVSPCTGLLYDTITVQGTWPQYQWSNGQTTPSIQVYNGGAYSVTVTDTTGCRYTDNAVLAWSPPSIYGLVASSNYVMLQNQKVKLVDYDSLTQQFVTLDSTWTDSLGYYYFCNVTDSVCTIKAEPNAFDYPTELPTYADASLFWSTATAFYPATQSPILHNFITLGSQPGIPGTGYIGGFVTEATGNVNVLGPPVPGLTVFLQDLNLNTVVGIRHTNAFGYFGFPNLPLHSYRVVVDYAYVVGNNCPIVNLTPQDPIRDSLDFRLHRDQLELILQNPTAVNPGKPAFSAAIHPNPFGGASRLLLNLQEAADCEAIVYDPAGRAVAQLPLGQLPSGSHAMTWGESLAPGLYMVRIRAGEHTSVLRAVKQ